MSYTDALPFLRAWMSDPLRVAAIAPSGVALAELITTDISGETGPVLELGPGTGVFTRALLAQGVAEQDLTLVEFGSDFVLMLGARFPGARILCMDAARIGHAGLFQDTSVDAIVSGLPLLSMPPRKIMAVLAGAFGYLRSEAGFHQFTYGPYCPVPRRILDRLGLKATRIGGTLRNIPPASVYRISRRPISSAAIAVVASGRRDFAV